MAVTPVRAKPTAPIAAQRLDTSSCSAENFYDRQWQFEQSQGGMFGNPDYKKMLEDYFGIDL